MVRVLASTGSSVVDREFEFRSCQTKDYKIGMYCFSANKMKCELMLTYDNPAYMFNVYKNQLSRQIGNRNLTGPKTFPTIWHTYIIYVYEACDQISDFCHQ